MSFSGQPNQCKPPETRQNRTPCYLSTDLSLQLKTLVFNKSYPHLSLLLTSQLQNIIHHSRQTSACLTLWIWPAAYRFCFGQAPMNKLVPAISPLWKKFMRTNLIINMTMVMTTTMMIIHVRAMVAFIPYMYHIIFLNNKAPLTVDTTQLVSVALPVRRPQE